MEISDEMKGMRAAEAEAEILKEYAGKNEAEMDEELDNLEGMRAGNETEAQALEVRKKVVQSALESTIWQTYLGFEDSVLVDELAGVREAKEQAEETGQAREVRRLARVETVLVEMIVDWI